MRNLGLLFCALIMFGAASRLFAESNEIIIVRTYPKVGFGSALTIRFTVGDANAVTRADLLEMYQIFEENDVRPDWQGYWSVPSSNTYMKCPHWVYWVPCATYDRVEYVACVSEVQLRSATNVASIEQEEACYYGSISR